MPGTGDAERTLPFHGGNSTGPRTAIGLARSQNARIRVLRDAPARAPRIRASLFSPDGGTSRAAGAQMYRISPDIGLILAGKSTGSHSWEALTAFTDMPHRRAPRRV